MNNLFRITGYCLKQNVGFIADSYGRFEKLWQFSSYLLNKGVEIIAVNTSDKFTKGNIEATKPNDNIIIRACAMGRPQFENGVITVNGKSYKPDTTA